MSIPDFAPRLNPIAHNNGLIVLGNFSGDIPTAAGKFSEGCLLIKTDEVDGKSATFQNVGTVAAPVWSRVSVGGDSSPNFFVASSTATDDQKAMADYVCDGTADNVEIQAALDALPANGGRVELSEGTFNIAATINMTSYDQLVGHGWGTRLFAVNNLNSTIIQMGAATGTNYGMDLEDLYIDGNQNNQTSGHGIKTIGSYHGIIRNVWVRYVYGYGLWLSGTGGQPYSAYNVIDSSLFTDGYKDNAVGIYCDGVSEFNFFRAVNSSWHTGNQGKGIYLLSGNNVFQGGQADMNGYNLYIAGNVKNKFYGISFDRATYREVWLTGGTQHNIFNSCQFGYYVSIPTLATPITAGATITSITLATPIPQDIPTWGVTLKVSYGLGTVENFTVTNAGAAAGSTVIPVNSKVATQSHAAGVYTSLRYRAVDHQGGAGPNFFTNCIWNGTESLPTNVNWDKQVGEDGGTTGVYEGNIFNGGGGVSLQSGSIFAQTNLLGTLISDNTVKQGFGTNSPTAVVDINSDILRLRTAKTPASAAATGNAGDICWDASYVYVCVATNTWKRSAIATW